MKKIYIHVFCDYMKVMKMQEQAFQEATKLPMSVHGADPALHGSERLWTLHFIESLCVWLPQTGCVATS